MFSNIAAKHRNSSNILCHCARGKWKRFHFPSMFDMFLGTSIFASWLEGNEKRNHFPPMFGMFLDTSICASGLEGNEKYSISAHVWHVFRYMHFCQRARGTKKHLNVWNVFRYLHLCERSRGKWKRFHVPSMFDMLLGTAFFASGLERNEKDSIFRQCLTCFWENQARWNPISRFPNLPCATPHRIHPCTHFN